MKKFTFLLGFLIILPISALGAPDKSCRDLLADDSHENFLSSLKENLPAGYSHLKPETVRKIYLWWMHQKDEKDLERRPKFLSEPDADRMDGADPAAPVQYTKPDGQKVYSIRTSPQHLEAGELENLLKGGSLRLNRQNVKAVKLVYADGTVMFDPSQTQKFKDYSAWSAWDLYLVYFPALKKYVGYGGTMLQPYKIKGDTSNKKLPDFNRDNPTRTRHAYDVTFEKDGDGRDIEVWTDRGSIFPGEPTAEKQWIDGEFSHGYGSRVFMNAQGEPWTDKYGYNWMVYDKVTEQKQVTDPSGKTSYIPFKTEIRARRLRDPFHVFNKGELTLEGVDAGDEVIIANVTPKANETQSQEPFVSTDRGVKKDGSKLGYLVEGPNPHLITTKNEKGEEKKYYIILTSSGNFTEDSYGVDVRYVNEEQGPIAWYNTVLDEIEQSRKFAGEFRSLGLHWGFARADFFYDHDGQGWILGHGILKDDLSQGSPTSGFPPANKWHEYRRQIILVPAHWTEVNGQPHLNLELPPLTDDVIESYFAQKNSSHGSPK